MEETGKNSVRVLPLVGAIDCLEAFYRFHEMMNWLDKEIIETEERIKDCKKEKLRSEAQYLMGYKDALRFSKMNIGERVIFYLEILRKQKTNEIKGV